MNNIIAFDYFLQNLKIPSKHSKIDVVIHFMWYHHFVTGNPNIEIKAINEYFSIGHLPLYNVTHLKRDLAKNKAIVKGDLKNTYKLNRNKLIELNQIYNFLIKEPISYSESVNLNVIPYLSIDETENAKKMAELYIVLHCLENSVRHFIENILQKQLGDDWWNVTKSSDLERRYTDRKSIESKKKWLSPRGSISPLYYLDWGDLVKIIRKNEAIFNTYFPSIKFVELKLEELENIRNIVAHNGVLPDDSEFERVKLYFNDWCKQLKKL